MFYVSSCKDGLYGITDTRDGVEEFYNIGGKTSKL